MDSAIRKHDRLLGVEVRHLAALEAVADSGSFAAAGRALGYSQSAISQQIAALEQAAGMRLLDRPGGRRPVTTTEAGDRLLRHARRAAAAMRAAGADLNALAQGEAGTLRVGTFQSAGVRLLPRVIRRFADRLPAVDVRLSEADYDDELRSALLSGAVDLAFVQRTSDPAIAHVDVLSDPYVLLVPASSDAARARRPVRMRELATLPLICYRRPEGGEAYLRSRGIEPQVVFRSDESGTVQGLVGAGMGSALVPLLTVEQGDPEVVVVEVVGVPPREITLGWHADRELSPAASAFVEVVEEVAAGLRVGLPA